MSISRSMFLAGFIILVSGGALAVAAPLSTDIVYQGQLKEYGLPVDGTLPMTFQLFDAEAGGNPVGSAIVLSAVVVTNGLFQVTLNFGPAAFSGEQRYLQVTAGGVGLSPRQRIAAAPYALHALNAPDGTSLDAADGSPTDALKVDANGWVGIGTATPQAELHVRPSPNNPLGTVLVTPGAADSISQLKLMENSSATLGSVIRHDGGANQLRFLGQTTDGVEIGPHMVIGRDNGRVGIGTISPATPLHVAGNVRVDGAIAITAVERYVTLVAEDFAIPDDVRLGFSAGFPADLGVTTGISGSVNNAEGEDVVTFAAVHLPHGAVVTELQVKILDTAVDQSMTAYLMRESMAQSAEYDIMAQVVSVNHPTDPTVRTDSTVVSATVDNSAYLYRMVLEWDMPPFGEFISCYWVRIKYTVTAPLP